MPYACGVSNLFHKYDIEFKAIVLIDFLCSRQSVGGGIIESFLLKIAINLQKADSATTNGGPK